MTPVPLPPTLPRKVVTDTGNITLTKHDLQLQMKIKVTVHEISQLATEGKTHAVFCVFEVRARLARDHDPLLVGALIRTHGCSIKNSRVRRYAHKCPTGKGPWYAHEYPSKSP